MYFGLGRVLFLLLPTATNIQPTFLAIVQNALKGGVPALVWLTIGENVCTLPSQRVMFAHIVYWIHAGDTGTTMCASSGFQYCTTRALAVTCYV